MQAKTQCVLSEFEFSRIIVYGRYKHVFSSTK